MPTYLLASLLLMLTPSVVYSTDETVDTDVEYDEENEANYAVPSEEEVTEEDIFYEGDVYEAQEDEGNSDSDDDDDAA